MKTVIYTVEITDVLTDEDYDEWLAKDKNGMPDTHKIASVAKKQLDVDDVVITKVQVFEDVD